MTSLKSIFVAAGLALTITVAACAAYAGASPKHPFIKCEDFACQP